MSKTKTKTKRTVDLAATLRQAFEKSDLTMYQLAKDAGLDRAQVGRFVRGERGLTLDAASRVCEVLGLDLRPVRKVTKKRS